MLITCKKCDSAFDIQQPGIFKCSVCGELLPEIPASADTTGNTAAATEPNVKPSRKNPVLKIIAGVFGLLALTGLVFGGWWAYRHFFCKNALDYVPASANYLVYGNTELLFDTKVWQTFSSNKVVKDNFIKELKRTLALDSVEDLAGNFVVWGRIPDAPSAAVIVLDNDNAADIFDAIKKKIKDTAYKVEVENIDGGRKLIVYKHNYGGYNHDVDWSLIQVGDDVLQISFNGEQGKIFEPDGDNKMAKLIDRSAVAAAAISPQAWGEIKDEIQKSEGEKIDFDRLGYGVIEVFCSKKELEIKARLDISEL